MTSEGDFSEGPVVMVSSSNAADVGINPGQGAKIQHASWPKNQNIKLNQYCNKFNKDFKNGPWPQEAGIYNGEKTASSISGAGKTEQLHIKE